MAAMFETERLTVRRIELGDAAFMVTMLNDPGFLANIGDRGVRTIEEAETYIRERVHASYDANSFGMFRVALKDSDEPVGTCGFVRREGLGGPDLGFAYLAAHTGKGYGYEAGRGMLAWGHDALGLGPLLAITAIGNAASAALLRKLGLREQGRVAIPGYEDESRFFVETT
jgi:ribosomal-protein-alanine N-acetyltransferase